jgi:predicted permease
MSLIRDLHYGLRQLRRNRLFHIVIILLLALGIGSNTLVFSLVNQMLLKPLPVRNPENLYLLQSVVQRQVRPNTFFPYLTFRDVVQKNNLVAAAVAEEEWTQSQVIPLDTYGGVRLVMAQIVSPNYFTELGIQAALGRVLTESDAADSGSIPAVLSYQFWHSQFSGARNIIGQTIRLKSHTFVIVGVLPRDFHSSDIDRAPDIRLPVSAGPSLFSRPITDTASPLSFRILVRLTPGVSAPQAAAALQPAMLAFYEQLEREAMARRKAPGAEERLQIDLEDFRVVLEPIGYGISRLREQFASALRLLLGGVALLLLAVCANIAGLLLARSGERRREIGIRLAVGASRSRLIRQLLAENLLLAVPGAILGALLAYIALPYVIRLLPNPRDIGHIVSPQILTVSLDLRILAFTTSITVFCVLAFALAPAWSATRPSLTAEWKASARQGSRSTSAIAPIALQVACSTLLLAAAGLMLRTWRNLESLDPGLDRHHVVEFTADPFPAGYSPAQAAGFYRELERRVDELPGVRSTAYASVGIMRATGFKMTLVPRGVVLPPKTFLNTSSNVVGPRYFETMGIRLLAGRDLQLTDAGKMPEPAVVNHAFADFFFPHQSPIGQTLGQGTNGNDTPRYIVVGLSANAKYRSMREPEPPTIYSLRQQQQTATGAPVLYVRTNGAPSSIIQYVRAIVTALGPAIPIVETVTLDQEIQTTLWQERLVAILAAFFGSIAGSLAAIGLYGALSSAVTHRTHELGIRVAIGARAGHIVWTICGPLAWAIGVGLATGIAAAALLLRLTESLLFGIRALDPATLTGAVIFVLACAAAGSLRPTRKALRVDPAIALREE